MDQTSDTDPWADILRNHSEFILEVCYFHDIRGPSLQNSTNVLPHRVKNAEHDYLAK